MRLVVIGGNAAGLSAAARARRIDRQLDITVLERGPIISYSACGLPYYVEGRVRSIDELTVHTPEQFKRERSIAVRTCAAVSEIVHVRREVRLADGEAVPYDRLVIATGARPWGTGIAGADRPHVFTLHTPDDARRLRDHLDRVRPRTGAVVGAGYLGLEAADVLRSRGAQVTIWQADGSILNRQEEIIEAALRKHLDGSGIDLRLHAPVTAIGGDEVNGIRAEVVVLAVGFQPNTDLAVAAGIETGLSGAIRTDPWLETSLSGVFAAGDCAEVVHGVSGRSVHIPLGTTANKMGRVAGANAAGERVRFPGVVGTSIVQIRGLGIGVTGFTSNEARAEGFDAVAARIEALERPAYFGGVKTTVELVAERGSGRLLGGIVIGGEGVAGRINVLATALRSRLRIDEFELLDLAYAPPFARVWDPLLIAAQQLRKLVD